MRMHINVVCTCVRRIWGVLGAENWAVEEEDARYTQMNKLGGCCVVSVVERMTHVDLCVRDFLCNIYVTSLFV